jgi:hypothetical protein
MGCFNHKGNFSQLPVVAGDRIVVFVGISPKNVNVGDDGFAPGRSFTPITVPIRGEYNDYGGIENVDKTPGTEALEQFFDVTTETLVDWAERIAAECENQISQEKVKSVLKKVAAICNTQASEIELNYIMEHEEIFDHMVSTQNTRVADIEHWRLPHKYIEALGYAKNVLGKDNGYDIVSWTHETLPELKETCYVWLKDEFGDYSKISRTFAELCHRIGCEVPEEFNMPYYTRCFLNDIETIKKPGGKSDSDFFEIPYFNNEEYSFLRSSLQCHNGLYRHYYGMANVGALLAQFGGDENHLVEKYSKEVVEVAAFLNALVCLEMSWGVTNYYRQDVDYGQHVSFLEKCLDVVKAKRDRFNNEE